MSKDSTAGWWIQWGLKLLSLQFLNVLMLTIAIWFAASPVAREMWQDIFAIEQPIQFIATILSIAIWLVATIWSLVVTQREYKIRDPTRHHNTTVEEERFRASAAKILSHVPLGISTVAVGYIGLGASSAGFPELRRLDLAIAYVGFLTLSLCFFAAANDSRKIRKILPIMVTAIAAICLALAYWLRDTRPEYILLPQTLFTATGLFGFGYLWQLSRSSKPPSLQSACVCLTFVVLAACTVLTIAAVYKTFDKTSLALQQQSAVVFSDVLVEPASKHKTTGEQPGFTIGKVAEPTSAPKPTPIEPRSSKVENNSIAPRAVPESSTDSSPDSLAQAEARPRYTLNSITAGLEVLAFKALLAFWQIAKPVVMIGLTILLIAFLTRLSNYGVLKVVSSIRSDEIKPFGASRREVLLGCSPLLAGALLFAAAPVSIPTVLGSLSVVFLGFAAWTMFISAIFVMLPIRLGVGPLPLLLPAILIGCSAYNDNHKLNGLGLNSPAVIKRDDDRLVTLQSHFQGWEILVRLRKRAMQTFLTWLPPRGEELEPPIGLP